MSMNKKKVIGTVLLLFTAIIWGGSFVAQSSGGNAIGPFSFSCLRFLIATTAMLPVIKLLDKKSSNAIVPRSKDEKKLLFKAGITCGVFLTGTSVFQQLGMYMGTSSGKAGFLTACYIVFVPIISLFFRKKAQLNVWLSVVITLVGLYMLCVNEGFSVMPSDLLVLVCAFMCASRIMAVDRYVGRVDTARLACVQFATASALSGILMFFFDMKASVSGIIEWSNSLNSTGVWVSLLYAGALAGAVAFTLQIVGQRDLNPTVASLLMSLESAFSVLAGWLILGDKLSTRELIGCAVIFVALVISQLPEKKKALS